MAQNLYVQKNLGFDEEASPDRRSSTVSHAQWVKRSKRNQTNLEDVLIESRPF